MKEIRDINILAIESSCDETAAAVVHNGREVRSNVISSQIDLHKLYGGVVPEIASRKHIEKINQVIEEALNEAEVTLDDIDAVSYTHLDVYKRQERDGVGSMRSARDSAGCFRSGAFMKTDRFAIFIRSMSAVRAGRRKSRSVNGLGFRI